MSGRFFFAARDQALWQPRVSDTESQIPIGEFSPPPLLPTHIHNTPPLQSGSSCSPGHSSSTPMLGLTGQPHLQPPSSP